MYRINKRSVPTLVFRITAGFVSLAFLSFSNVAYAAPGPYWYPVANTVVQWNSSTGLANWQNVDENPCNGVADFNYTTSTGRQDLYRVDISALPNGTVLNTVWIEPCWSLYFDDGIASSSTISVIWSWNGAQYPVRKNQNRPAGTGTVPYYSNASVWTGLGLVKGPGTTLDIGVKLVSQEPLPEPSGAKLSRIRVRFYQ